MMDKIKLWLGVAGAAIVAMAAAVLGWFLGSRRKIGPVKDLARDEIREALDDQINVVDLAERYRVKHQDQKALERVRKIYEEDI